ncbi:SH3 domain-containing protein [Sphingobacterium arenae]|uniref:SH3 domain-containing protein n=1 Tax=Sphingobacterium arenae TaxID=1280598 RepID=A0ABR7Y5P0_9SPHI|nr:SH3 domain-containing protein [Sphingobacterium arenae]MBD1426633.1 SH3 domain-containing protein [Sphingobacterium arenae]
MALLNKYKSLITAAENLVTGGVQFMEQDSILIIKGAAPSAEVKDKLWDIYSQIDPNFISREVSLDIEVLATVKGCKAYMIVEEPILNIHKGPGVESPIIDKVQRQEIVIILSRTNVYWWLVRTNNSEGYCYAQNIELV